MLQITDAKLPVDALSQYYSEISNHELLTKDQEKKLANRFIRLEDEAAAERLVKANLRLVVKLARDYGGSGDREALSDLIQEGNLGLVHAVRHYDPEKKTKFSYYATFWIKAYMFKYLMNNYSTVKIGTTQAQRKLFFNLKKTREKLRKKGLSATPEQIATQLGVKPFEVEEMTSRMGQKDKSLNAPSRTRETEQLLDSIDDDGQMSAEDKVAGMQMRLLVRSMLAKFKPNLDQRELDILERRIVAQEPQTLKTLGDSYGVSRERIRQIEASIIQKLRNYFQTEIPDFQLYMAG